MEARRLVIATTRGALVRDTITQDDLGDDVSTPVEVPGWESFPISIIEREVDEYDRASNEWRTVRKLTGRTDVALPVDDGDRIKDLRDGVIYAVDGFTATPRGISGRSSVTMNLRRTAP